MMLVAAIAACRRLRVPWVWLPLVIAWPPFAEGIVDGNVAMLMFLAFVVLFYRPTGTGPWAPEPRDVAEPGESGVLVRSLSSFIATAKVSQPHAWLFVLRHRWRAAVAGAVVVALIALATLPLTGTDLWLDWIAQLRRAGEGGWDLGGFAIPRFLPPGVGLVVVGVCVVAVWFAPRRDPAPWVGVLSTIGSLSLHLRAAVPRPRHAQGPDRGGTHRGHLHRVVLVRGRVGRDRHRHRGAGGDHVRAWRARGALRGGPRLMPDGPASARLGTMRTTASEDV